MGKVPEQRLGGTLTLGPVSASGRVTTVKENAFSPTRVKRVSSHAKTRLGGMLENRAWRYMMENDKSEELGAKNVFGTCKIQGGNDDKSWSVSPKATLILSFWRNRKGKKPERYTTSEP